ncbi:NACHT domain-containing protein [Actinomadura rubrisoli]|uniref:ATP-binding protein n=1 Tax=Actinomadura rubrisoli TaxID=2530368 RepID=A0A4R5BSE8_9ACTN|nr:ATP-binding protein [Actinomadura rubrisoli]TDD88939.1 ATP-binding protein [Actinomadura rubrisoli]
MRREPALTYQGALKILGHYDRPRLERLDGLLGGAILGAGAAALGGAPLGAVAAIWGWVDQKNEATTLLRKLFDGASARLAATSGYERHQLIAAAHTTIAAAAFFEVLREKLGDEQYKDIGLTEAERVSLTAGPDRHLRERLVEVLYEAAVPAPSPARGFHENSGDVRAWMSGLMVRFLRFCEGLEIWSQVTLPVGNEVVREAVARYTSHYVRMAATVPEFYMWANLGEHAATRSQIADLEADLGAALQGQREGLARVEALLGRPAGAPEGGRDLCDVVHRANRGGLDEYLVSEEAVRAGPDLTFPSLREAFVNPRYRLAPSSIEALPADEKWWEEQNVHDDIDLMLAGQVTAPDAKCAPLLLLGHPGAGKSLLTKVLAARLPPSGYTVVRVPLRRVAADAPVYDQIQRALDLVTHERVKWWELAEQSVSTVRVVLLDGLDELLQAAGDRGGYLEEVVDFQRREAAQDRPVVVIVTSRTVVADRVRIPDGTTLVKLEDFDEAQVGRWLAVWNRVNEPAVSAGRARALRPEAALEQRELAKQPLLLLMLALYSADPSSAPLEGGISQADLYRRLLETFAYREVAKRAPSDADEAVREQLWRLSVAAFAMFNRARQDVTDVELGADLAALDEAAGPARLARLGRRLFGEFFFVHASEARTERGEEAQRCYEFLHATFGEYLMAAHVMELLRDMADSAFSGRRGTREPDDDLLFALLSHQTLATRLPTLTFAVELFYELDREERHRVLKVLELLTEGCRRRHGSDRYATYSPLPVDRVRQVAAYSGNLVLLRVMLGDPHDPASVELFWPGDEDPMATWRSTVALWSAGLDKDCWHSMLATIQLQERAVIPSPGGGVTGYFADLLHARLIGDAAAGERLRFGMAIREGLVYGGDDWHQTMLSWLVAQNAPRASSQTFQVILPRPPQDADRGAVAEIIQMMSMLLKTRAHELRKEVVGKCVAWVFRAARPEEIDSLALAAAVQAHPSLLLTIDSLSEPANYLRQPGAYLLLRGTEPRSGEEETLLERLIAATDAGDRHLWSQCPEELFETIDAVIQGHRWTGHQEDGTGRPTRDY